MRVDEDLVAGHCRVVEAEGHVVRARERAIGRVAEHALVVDQGRRRRGERSDGRCERE